MTEDGNGDGEEIVGEPALFITPVLFISPALFFSLRFLYFLAFRCQASSNFLPIKLLTPYTISGFARPFLIKPAVRTSLRRLCNLSRRWGRIEYTLQRKVLTVNDMLFVRMVFFFRVNASRCVSRLKW